jgi:hypothetical protein
MTIVQIPTGRFAVQLLGITVRTFPTREAAQAYLDSVEQ